MVVSTEGKRPGKTRSGEWQEEDRKGTTMEVSKAKRRCQNRGGFVTAGPSSDETCLRAERHPAWEVAWACQRGGWAERGNL